MTMQSHWPSASTLPMERLRPSRRSRPRQQINRLSRCGVLEQQARHSGKQSETVKENVKEQKKEADKKSDSGGHDEPYVPFEDMFHEKPDFEKYKKQDKLPDKYVIKDETDAKQMQYSAFGVPMTPDAWAMQTAIDGGKLHYLYDKYFSLHINVVI